MKKKIFVCLLAVSMVFTAGIPVFAQEKPTTAKAGSGIQVSWVNTDTVHTNLDFSGDRANCSCTIHAKSGTTKITATALLKRVDGNRTTTVKAWTGLKTSGDTFYFDSSYYVDSGYTYEFEINAKVCRNGKAETIRQSSTNYCEG